jgi:hypothetical protein
MAKRGESKATDGANKASMSRETTVEETFTRQKVGGGGPWEGPIWAPQGPTEEQAIKAAEYKNEIVEADSVYGHLHEGWAFDGKEVFYLARKKEGDKLLMPDHGGLRRDLGIALKKKGEGCLIEVVYRGKVVLQRGDFAGNEANAYDVNVLIAKTARR